MTSKRSSARNPPIAQAHHYVLAGQPVVFDTEVASLQAYHAGSVSDGFSEILLNANEPLSLNSGNASLEYHGQAPFNHQTRNVRFWRRGRFAQLDLDTSPVCHIDFNERHIYLHSDASFDDPLALEVITGPAMVLLLAELGTYCLHAGAIITEVGTVGIIAESGVGKSTLSAHAGDGWQQIADDILPVSISRTESSQSTLLGDYPQLKLTNAAAAVRVESPHKLTYLLRLNPQPAETVSVKKLNKAVSMIQIIRHTVAAKLFDQDLMREHSSFAKQVSVNIPMLELSYPRLKENLPLLRQSVVDAFSQFS